MKKLLIGLGALVVLVIAAALIAPFFIPTDAYRDKLITLVKDATGRDLRIDGPIKFSLLPSIALEANDVSFSNAPGGSAKNMAQLETLKVKLKLLPFASSRPSPEGSACPCSSKARGTISAIGPISPGWHRAWRRSRARRSVRSGTRFPAAEA